MIEVSRWTPTIFGHWTTCSREPLMSIFRWDLAWHVSAVKNVTDDFEDEINSELSFRYL